MATRAGYQAAYRKRNPEYVQRNRTLTAIRRKAQERLVRRHASEFAEIVNQMCERIGIDPPKGI